jgi:hypothetical protein
MRRSLPPSSARRYPPPRPRLALQRYTPIAAGRPGAVVPAPPLLSAFYLPNITTGSVEILSPRIRSNTTR